MPRVQPKNLTAEKRTELLDELWSMIALLETKEETRNFFKDLFSDTEAVMLARRIQIAKLLLQGISYTEISLRLQTSHGTIAAVHRWLQGSDRAVGYNKMIPKLQKEVERRERNHQKEAQSKIPYSKEWMKRRYPTHFLLLSLIDWATPHPSRKVRK